MTATPSPRVVVLAGGLSHERDVSLRSGRRVAEALRVRGRRGLACTTSTPTWCRPCRSCSPTSSGRSCTAPAARTARCATSSRCSGCACSGTGPRESRVAWSKPIAKTVVARAGLSTPDFVTLPQSLFRELGARQVLDAIVDRLGLPLVVKPSRGGSALGVTLVTQRRRPPAGHGRLLRLRRHRARRAGGHRHRGRRERRRPGRRAGRAARRRDRHRRALRLRRPLQPRAHRVLRSRAAVAELTSPRRRRRGASPRTGRSGSTGSPAPTSSSTTDGTVWFLEVNVAPGMTETSLLPQAAEAAGPRPSARSTGRSSTPPGALTADARSCTDRAS